MTAVSGTRCDDARLTDWLMPSHHAALAAADQAVKPPPPALATTSADTSNSSTPASAPHPPASDHHATAAAAAAADVDMETSMTTTADVQVHQPRDTGPPRHVRFDYCNLLALSCPRRMLR